MRLDDLREAILDERSCRQCLRSARERQVAALVELRANGNRSWFQLARIFSRVSGGSLPVEELRRLAGRLKKMAARGTTRPGNRAVPHGALVETAVPMTSRKEADMAKKTKQEPEAEKVIVKRTTVTEEYLPSKKAAFADYEGAHEQDEGIDDDEDLDGDDLDDEEAEEAEDEENEDDEPAPRSRRRR